MRSYRIPKASSRAAQGRPCTPKPNPPAYPQTSTRCPEAETLSCRTGTRLDRSHVPVDSSTGCSTGEGQQLVYGPPVVGVLTVLAGKHAAVARDQEVGGKAPPSTLGDQ